MLSFFFRLQHPAPTCFSDHILESLSGQIIVVSLVAQPRPFPAPVSTPRPLSQNVQTPAMQTAAVVSRLTLKASNEYGEYEPSALSLYGIDMVVEPHRETTLTTQASGKSKDPRFSWRVVEADASDVPAVEEEHPVVVVDAEGGPEITVTLTSPGRAFLVTVEELQTDGMVVARGSATASCKYVRRELRDLTELDRVEFLDAMEAYYKTSDVEGLAKYGEAFSNYERLTAYHNAAVSESAEEIVSSRAALVVIIFC